MALRLLQWELLTAHTWNSRLSDRGDDCVAKPLIMPTNTEMPDLAMHLVASGGAVVLPMEYSIGFDQYLMKLPFAGSGIDWRRMPPSLRLNVSTAPEASFGKWLEGTGIGQHDYASVWYSREQSGVVVPLKELSLGTLDGLYRGRPGYRYLFGIDLVGGRIVPSYQDLLQYIGTRDVVEAVSKRA